ncbi:fatty acid desaturase family protein [Humibacillus xanthopallidus]|uniref:fatty acid desaturase family protein n=1 Tax=Humibacillus xanthopallidus TaxID=412689 RepID=UPI00384CE61A
MSTPEQRVISAVSAASTVSAFSALTRQVQEMGLLRRRRGYYWIALCAVLTLSAWVAAFVRLGDTWWQLGMAAVLAVILTQVAFLGHDAAHRQMFTSSRWNGWVSLVVANLLVGISHGLWRSKHNRQHANPNKDGADPDVAPGALAFTPSGARRSNFRVVRWAVRHQGWYFFPLTLFEGVSLHWDGIRRVTSRQASSCGGLRSPP